MVERTRRPKAVMYKRAEFNQPGLTLQELLDQAFKMLERPAQRRQNIGQTDDAPGLRRVIGGTREIRPMIFGTMLYYEPGKDITFVIEDEDAEEFIIKQESPHQDRLDGRNSRREVLQSALYFGVLGNHLVVCQSQSLRARELEKHLNWLLGEKLNLLPSGVGVGLSDEPTQRARQAVQNLSVKSVELGTPLSSVPENAGSAVSSVKSHIFSGSAVDALKSLIRDGALDRLHLDEALDDANLEVTVQVRYRRSTTDSGHKALDHIARAMRHAEPEDTKIITSSGTVIQGDDMKVTTKLYVDTYNGVVDHSDMYNEMLGWLQKIMQEGVVT